MRHGKNLKRHISRDLKRQTDLKMTIRLQTRQTTVYTCCLLYTSSSRMVGLVGSSNNPVSGMAIATLLIATMVSKASGNTGIDGMKAAIAIGDVYKRQVQNHAIRAARPGMRTAMQSLSLIHI